MDQNLCTGSNAQPSGMCHSSALLGPDEQREATIAWNELVEREIFSGDSAVQAALDRVMHSGNRVEAHNAVLQAMKELSWHFGEEYRRRLGIRDEPWHGCNHHHHSYRPADR